MHTTVQKQLTVSRRARIIGAFAPRAELALLSAFTVLSGLLFSPASQAEFAMNFSGTQSTSIVHGASFIGGQTPFTPMGPNQATGEAVVDPSNGLLYWHYVLGDPSTGFAQELYIRATTGSCAQGSICSASGGFTGFGTRNVLDANTATASGNGTGNPNNIIMRQVLGGSWNASTQTWTCDTGYCSEFVKSAYANKPKITQGINDGNFTSRVILDMSSVAISDSSTTLSVTDGSTGATGASMTNVQSVYDPTTATTIDFDMAVNAQTTNVTGGRYTYTNGNGVLGASGTYVYVDGGYNPKAVDYSVYLDHSVSNPWAYPATQP